jgi:transcriptional regulator with PAS, ATPase and Fis domain
VWSPSFKLDETALEESFQKFRNTTNEITSAAQGAAEVLGEQLQRIKACFQALNSASDCIVILNNVGEIYFCNDSFVDTFKVNNYKDTVGKNLRDIVDVPSYTEMWQSVSNNKSWYGECCKRFTIAAVPMMNGQPHPLYIICTFKQKQDKYSTGELWPPSVTYI